MLDIIPNDENKTVDLSSVDVNKIIAMTFNFDSLKQVLTTLIKNQKNFESQLSEIKSSILMSKTQNMDYILQENQEQKKEDEDQEENLEEKEQNQKIEENSEQNEKNEQNVNDNIDQNLNENNEQKENENNEQNLNDNNEQKENGNIEQKEKEKEKKKETKKEIEKKKDETKEPEKILTSSSIQEAKIKEVKNSSKKSSGKLELEKNKKALITLEENQKNEIVKTNKLVDETKVIKKDLADVNKELKVLLAEVKNIKTENLNINKNLSSIKQESSDKLEDRFRKELPKFFDTNISPKITKVQNENSKKFEDMQNNFLNFQKNYENQYNELKKNITEIISREKEKNIEIEEIKNNINTLRKKIDTINDKLSNTVTIFEFNQFKNDHTEKNNNDIKDVKTEINIIKTNIGNLRNQLYDITNDQTDHNALQTLIQKNEVFSGNLQKLMDFKTDYEEKERRKVVVETNKYVRQDGFNELINSLHKEIDINKRDFQDIRIEIENIRTKGLNTKACLRDLKNLEDSVLCKMELLKETIKDKFVDKNLLSKNIKIVEYQTKQLIEESKKTEKVENWLLAKKPIGHQCASCEAYIGDLKQNTNTKYIAWNKYPPPKDPIDKMFKINAGFSKVLQMVSQDVNKNRNNSLGNSREERERHCPSASNENGRNKNNNNDNIMTYKAINRNKGRNSPKKYNDDNDSANSKYLPRITVLKKNSSSINFLGSEGNNNIKNISSDVRDDACIISNFEEKKQNSGEEDVSVSSPKITKVMKRQAAKDLKE